MTRLSPFVVMLATALSASGTGLAARAQDLPPGDIANGKRVYLATGCFTCHGRAGQGARTMARRRRSPRPLCLLKGSKCRYAIPPMICRLTPSRLCPIARSPTFTHSCNRFPAAETRKTSQSSTTDDCSRCSSGRLSRLRRHRRGSQPRLHRCLFIELAFDDAPGAETGAVEGKLTRGAPEVSLSIKICCSSTIRASSANARSVMSL